MHDWWLDERTTAGDEHLDPGYVDGYDARAGYDPRPDVDALVARGLGPGSRLLDLGAGTGTFAFAAAETGASVTAVDVSPAMVASMRDRAAREAAAITVVEAGFLSYAHVGPPVDFVFTRNALHQLPDVWKAVALVRVAATMRTGAILRLLDLVYDSTIDDLDTVVGNWMAGAVDDPAQGYTADDLATHVRTEHSTFTWLLEPVLERAGFEILERDVRKSVYATYTCRRH